MIFLEKLGYLLDCFTCLDCSTCLEQTVPLVWSGLFHMSGVDYSTCLIQTIPLVWSVMQTYALSLLGELF